jgi:trans-aconitate methyltransferase
VPAGDSWATGDAYEAYMGRWSRTMASAFLDWLAPPAPAHWLEVGCGTGALTSSILERTAPLSIVACDPSAPFVEHARRALSDPRVSFVNVGAEALPGRPGGFDAVVSGLVLNFLPQPAGALEAMVARLRPGGLLAAYVWDYADGMEPLVRFWEAAVALDPAAARLDERTRFPVCALDRLAALFEGAGLQRVAAEPLEREAPLADFDDYWRPFLGGTGPAPSYVASLDPARREQLRDRLRQRLGAGSPLRLRTRALAVRGFAP